ncbi:hypothetical protein H671_2g5604 [Cricetulus griseus]|uniref:Uncharacterized protein n=1 Tax=Cricetulus griseus TaxID=10029 RepID=A0A061IFG5_CRIGR|nr:hypothetical protein H671_2g5604 [Cricetulus griseus]
MKPACHVTVAKATTSENELKGNKTGDTRPSTLSQNKGQGSASVLPASSLDQMPVLSSHGCHHAESYCSQAEMKIFQS